MPDEYLVVVIAPDREPEKCLLKAAKWVEGNDWSYVTVDKKGDPVKVDNNGLSDDCIFVLINQCQQKCEIEKHLKEVSTLNKKVIAWTHKTDESYKGNEYDGFPCKSIEEILTDKKIHCDDFSHTDESPAEPILDFMKSFSETQNGATRVTRLKKIIEDTIKIHAVSDAHKLRADILTPFIPFHLYHQLGDKEKKGSEWKDIFEECCKEINKKEDNGNRTIIKKKCEELNFLKNKVLGGIKLFSNDVFNTLITNFQTGEGDCVEKVKETACHETIEAFAKYLEEIVNSIEESKDN